MGKKATLRFIFRAPVYLYRWHLGWLLDHRFLLLTHIGRRTDWLRNIEAIGDEEVTVGLHHFTAKHRVLSEDEAMRVLTGYEYRNRVLAPLVRSGLSWVLGWRYRGGEEDRRRLVHQLPLIAFRPQA